MGDSIISYSDSSSPSPRRKPISSVSDHLSEQVGDDTQQASESTGRDNDELTGIHLLNNSSSGKAEIRHHANFAPGKNRSLYARCITDGWLLEIICWLIAVAFVGAIIAILFVYHGKGVPQWPGKVTINTAISIFSTIAKAALLVPVASCLSQLKWIWFTSQSRRLTDLQDFDNASRGAIGSVTLLLKLKGRALGVIGAVIMITSLALSPVTQALVSFPVVRVRPVKGSANAFSCVDFIGGSFIPEGSEFSTKTVVTYQVTAALYGGLLSSTTLEPIEPECSTGNCTWEPYQSLAVCAHVEDVTDQLSEITSKVIIPLGQGAQSGEVSANASVIGWMLPNGAGVVNSVLNLTSNGPAVLAGARVTDNSNQIYPPAIGSLAFKDVLEPLSDFFIVFSIPGSPGHDGNPSLPLASIAYECMLQLCVQNYTTNTTNGISTTEILSTYFNNKFQSSAGVGDNNYGAGPGDIYNYQVDKTAASALEEYLSLAISGSYGVAVANYSGQLTATNGSTTSDIAGGIYNAIGIAANNSDVSKYLSNTKDMMNNIATSLTNSIRQGGSVEPGPTVTGHYYQDQTVVKVHWLWIIFPASLLFLTFVLLIGTMVCSSQTKIRLWKSSVTALMQILSDDERKDLGSLEYTSAIDARAKTIKVSLEREDEEGWKLLKRRGTIITE